MAQKSIHENFLGMFDETTVCQGPADWAADGTWMHHISCDTSGIKQTLIKDPSLEGRLGAVGTRPLRKGSRNTTVSASLPFTGTGVTTADATQVTQTHLGNLFEHCMGGSHRGSRHAVVAGTTTVIELAAVTNIIPGCLVAVQDTTSPTAANAGKLHVRRVTEVDAVTKEVTVHPPLGFTPAAGDICHPLITGYLDWDVLTDAFGTNSTKSWFIRKARSGTDLLWELVGGVASMKLDGLSKGGLPSLSLDIMACDFKHGGTDGLTNPSPTVFKGQPQLAMGRNALCFIGAQSLNVTNVSFEPGFTRVRQDSTTEPIDRSEGTATYSVQPGDTKVTLTVSGYEAAWYDALEAGTEQPVLLYMPGDGSGAGKTHALMLARAQLLETPARTDLNENHATTLSFLAMEPEDCVGGSNEMLERSRFLLGSG